MGDFSFKNFLKSKQQDYNLTTEMIDPQLNDAIVQLIAEQYEKLINVSQLNKFKSNVNFFKNNESKQIINNISSDISKRFGFNFTIFNSDFDPIMCIPAPPLGDNIFRNTDYYEYYKQLEDYVDNTNDNDSQITKLYSNLKTIDETLKTKEIVVDLHNAVIRGLPNDYNVSILINFDMLINKLNITSKEFTAMLLHEIGHCFTYIEYSYRQIKSTTVLADTFLENIKKKNLSAKESLILAYKNVTNDTEIDKIKDKNVIPVTVAIVDRYLKYLKPTENIYYYTDSEQVADQFAGKFGLGVDLITAHEKIIKVINVDIIRYNKLVALTTTPIIAYTLISMLAIISPLVIAIVGIMITVGFLSFLTTDMYTPQNVSRYNEYDDVKQRYIRIRNELIRTLRTSSLDNKTIKSFLNNIEKIDKIIEAVPANKPFIVETILRSWLPSKKRKLELRTIDQLIENLMENNLHVASAKFNLNNKG